MVFNSVTFAVFLAAVLVLHWSVPRRARNPVLLVASYVFYGAWDWRFCGLLALSTVIDFNLARILHASDDPRRRLQLLRLSAGINLGILGVFKYFNFFISSFEDFAASVGLGVSGPALSVILPVGISFYTFQTISYTFDVYRGRIEPTTDPVTFATYVAYFPQLVAGPIERAQALLPRLANIDRQAPTGAALERALGLILLGLFKKVVIADGVAQVADAGFADGVGWVTTAMGILAFALQIYGDFSGYTDIARGVSRLFGIELVVNFTQPYLSRNITEFWRRWHISLSNWLRDYLYIPLGGNRSGVAGTIRNLMITMILGGLWHGASWNFVIWGTLHGLYLAAHRVFRGGRVPSDPIGLADLPAMVFTFALVGLTWVPFRAGDLSQVGDMFGSLLSLESGEVSGGDLALLLMMTVIAFGLDLLQRRVTTRSSPKPIPAPLLGAAVGAATVGILIYSGGTPQPFIYFQF